MKKSTYALLPSILIFVSVFLNSCSSPNRLPQAAEKALETYWQSLPSYPTITNQIQQVWPGVVPAETIMPLSSNMDIWCVITEITAADDVSIIGENVTWIVFRNDEGADWTAAMLATMSALWPYEACGTGP